MAAFDVTKPGSRLLAYLHFWWNDHAYLRLSFQNAHWISEELVRTNQPWPFQLEAWKARGVRTIINLRGDNDESFHALEREACERYGLKLVHFVVGSREVPSRETVLGARELFESIEYPAVMHCKSGADRAGIMSVLYAHYRLGQPIREAAKQLSFRYMHVRHALTGVLDYVFERYLTEAEPEGISFTDWVKSDAYDPAAIKADFRSSWWGTLLIDKIFRRE